MQTWLIGVPPPPPPQGLGINLVTILPWVLLLLLPRLLLQLPLLPFAAATPPCGFLLLLVLLLLLFLLFLLLLSLLALFLLLLLLPSGCFFLLTPRPKVFY